MPDKGSIFERCRGMSSSEAARRLGIQVIKKGKQEYALCPFHHEKTPSLAFYEDGNWYCYGCHSHGDAVHFVARLKGVRPLEAARWLLEEVPKPARLVAPRSANGVRESLDALEDWFDREWDVACEMVREMGKQSDEALAEILAEGGTEDEAWQDARFFLPEFVRAAAQTRLDLLGALEGLETVRLFREETLRSNSPGYWEERLKEEEKGDVRTEE